MLPGLLDWMVPSGLVRARHHRSTPARAGWVLWPKVQASGSYSGSGYSSGGSSWSSGSSSARPARGSSYSGGGGDSGGGGASGSW